MNIKYKIMNKTNKFFKNHNLVKPTHLNMKAFEMRIIV